MRLNVAGFVDVGFVRAAVAQACGIDTGRVRLDAAELVRTVEEVAAAWTGLTLRVYWYDGQHPASDARHTAQRKYLDAVAATPGIQLRLGHLYTRTPAWHGQLQQALETCGVDRAQFDRHFTFAPESQQKGVDTLMVLDIVRLAQRRAYDIAVVFSGDRDIAEAVRAAQDEGRRVTLVVPDARSVASELRALADEVIVFDADRLRSLNRAPGAAGRGGRDARPTPANAGDGAKGAALGAGDLSQRPTRSAAASVPSASNGGTAAAPWGAGLSIPGRPPTFGSAQRTPDAAPSAEQPEKEQRAPDRQIEPEPESATARPEPLPAGEPATGSTTDAAPDPSAGAAGTGLSGTTASAVLSASESVPTSSFTSTSTFAAQAPTFPSADGSSVRSGGAPTAPADMAGELFGDAPTDVAAESADMAGELFGEEPITDMAGELFGD